MHRMSFQRSPRVESSRTGSEFIGETGALSPFAGAFRVVLATAAAMTLLAGGCGPRIATPEGDTVEEVIASASDDDLRDRIDEALTWTYKNRHLTLKDNAAWQILHGVIAYQRDFLVRNEAGEEVSAIDHLMQGGQMRGWHIHPGTMLPDTGRRGLATVLEQGSKTGQGHTDQWLAILAQSELTPDQTIQVEGETFTMEDMVRQSMWDVPRNGMREYSWTIIGLTSYLPTTASWVAQDGKTWTIEELVQAEAEQDINDAACGGTHRLVGLTMALNRHVASGGEVTGGWKAANDVIQKARRDAFAYQNPDGSFSSNYVARPGSTADLGQRIGSSGHVLEFLVISATDEELHDPAMRRAVVHMCDLFDRTRTIDLECGGLYHAAHGLVLYRQRLFGPKNYANPDAAPVADASTPTTSESTPSDTPEDSASPEAPAPSADSPAPPSSPDSAGSDE